jgi:hypothetical protein
MKLIEKITSLWFVRGSSRMHVGRNVVEDVVVNGDGGAGNGLTMRLAGLRLKTGALSLLSRRQTDDTAQPPQHQSAQSGAKAAGEWTRLALDAARRLGRHAEPEKLRRDYRQLLHVTQEVAHDRAVERLFFRPTRGPVALDQLTIASPNRRFGHDYRPVHRLSFDAAMAELPERFEEFTFVDYGAGRGRALLLASMHPFRRIVGVEFASELHDDANMNIAQFPRSLMKCRDVECRLMDAIDFAIPNEKCVLFFNDPFDDEVLTIVLERIAASYRAQPRRMYLVFVRPETAPPIDRLMELAVVFEPVGHSRAQQVRLQLLCPEQVQLFRTLL